jgi:uncharacterized DUF497 family protein
LLSITIPDFGHGTAEERFVIIGFSEAQRLLVVVHVVVHIVRAKRIRLISAREATKPERRSYEENTL